MSNTNPTAAACNFLSFAKEAIVPPFPPRRSCCKFTIVWQRPAISIYRMGAMKRNETNYLRGKLSVSDGEQYFIELIPKEK